ncbi:MAG: hypothetical protein QOJ68_2461, partial [Blastococcus sp.]|nr:hypothetical protein [Blastococcus sp.]
MRKAARSSRRSTRREFASVIDDHVHPFPLEFTSFDLGELGLDVDQAPAAAARRRRLAPGRLYVHLIEARLADHQQVSMDEV